MQTLTAIKLDKNLSNYCVAVAAAIQIRNDKVWQFLLRDHFRNYQFSSMKTLIKLELSGSEIGDKGAVHLAKALRNNTVPLISSSCLSN